MSHPATSRPTTTAARAGSTRCGLTLLLVGLLAATLLALSPAPAQAARFDDVPPEDVFVSDIDRLAAAGITKGCDPPDNDLFCPDELVTRGQMAAFLVRAGLAPAPDVPGLRTGPAAFSQDGTPDAPAPIEADGFDRRAPFALDPGDPEPVSGTASDPSVDVIRPDDPSTHVCTAYRGRGSADFLRSGSHGNFYEEVPDAFRFVARYDDGTAVDLFVHPEFGSRDAATSEIAQYERPLGQLPTLLRRDIGTMRIRSGFGTASASSGLGVNISSRTMAERTDQGLGEELLFHDAVHTVAADAVRSALPGMARAQVADGRWLSTYARENPDSEDVAETVVISYGLLHHRDRLTPALEQGALERVPNRTALVALLVPPDQPVFSRRDAEPTCG